MKYPKIGLVTGLGSTVSSQFAECFKESLGLLFGVTVVTECFVDANHIIPILTNRIRVASIVLDALQSIGNPVPDLVLIPCNSVHIASPHLTQAFGDSFIPIDQAVLSMIRREHRHGRFLILGTTTTVEAGFYQEGLCRLGCEALTLPADAQAQLDEFIFRELVYGPMNPEHLQTLRELEFHFKHRLAADHVILACTELCYLVRVFSQPKSYEVDSLQALHDAGLSRLHYLMEGGLNHATRYSHIVG
ncbi:aspartate/glutamate racemase family protein [Methyloglobulus sp.]|uniref:aspartate/glutamate racemase family protein n=1 Tax=Methyloglobulus sp. TaxID=2518622 RepID=UPI003989696E